MLDILCTTLLPNVSFNSFVEFQLLACYYRVEDSVDPDQLASQKPADLDLHCFQKQDISGLSWTRVKNKATASLSLSLSLSLDGQFT